MRYLILLLLISCSLFGQRSGSVMTSYNNSSAVASSTVTENSLPSIQITSPSDGDTLTIDTSFTASVTATDSDGTIDSVVFFINDTRQAVDVSSPYTYNLPTGSVINRELKAIAYDNDLGTGIDSINYYINDTTTPVVAGSDSTYVEIEDMTFTGSADPPAVYTIAGASGGETTLLQQDNHKREYTLTHDIDSIYFQIRGRTNNTPVEFDILKNGTPIVDNVSVANGEFKAEGAGVTADSGDVLTFTTSSWFCEGDYAVFYRNFTPANPPASDNYTFSLPENEDYDYAIGATPLSVTGLKDTLDSEYFYWENDTLYSKYSFDYENTFYTEPGQSIGQINKLDIYFTTTGEDSIGQVNITDKTGSWDTPGFVTDSSVVDYYPSINYGDFVIWGGNTGPNNEDFNMLFETYGVDSISYPNKILIKGGQYDIIRLYLSGVTGNNTSEPIVITNFLGQVKHYNGFGLKEDMTYVRLTGQYDSINGYGHRWFRGCDQNGSTIDFTHAQEKFGIYGDDKWESQRTGHAFAIDGGDFYGVEVDHIAAGNGWFSGLNWKWNDNFAITDSCKVHHVMFFDIGSEGLYQGSTTQSKAQQLFKNFEAYNNAFIRIGGEGIQTGRLLGGAKIYNNFSHSGLDWKDPFQRYQDGNFQAGINGGSHIIRDNIFLGFGEAGSNVQTQPSPIKYGIRGDSLSFINQSITKGSTLTSITVGDPGLTSNDTLAIPGATLIITRGLYSDSADLITLSSYWFGDETTISFNSHTFESNYSSNDIIYEDGAPGQNWPQSVEHDTGTVYFVNNYAGFGKGPLWSYIPDDTDSVTSIFIDSNYIGNVANWGSTIWEVFNQYQSDGSDPSYVYAIEIDQDLIPNVVTRTYYNYYDSSITAFNRNSKPLELGNTQQSDSVPIPQFRRYLDTAFQLDGTEVYLGGSFNFHHFERYTDTIGTENTFIKTDTDIPGGASRKGEAAWWEVGDIVQYFDTNGVTRFYIAIQGDSTLGQGDPSQDPNNLDNSYWKYLRWKIKDSNGNWAGEWSNYPPDDIRLEQGSFYDNREMGLIEP